MARATAFICLILCSAAATSSKVSGQVPPPPLKPLDQAREDVGPLSASLREMQTELRQPTGFQNVYRVPGRDDLLMRMDGGLIAVFPRSAYVQTGKNARPVIPAGTVFLIGPPIGGMPGAPGSVTSGNHERGQFEVLARINPQVQARQNDGASAPPAAVETELSLRPGLDHARPVNQAAALTTDHVPTIANDSAYRAQRLRQLMQQASAAAERQADKAAETSFERGE